MNTPQNVKRPSFARRFWITVLALLALAAIHYVWNIIETPIAGLATVQQVNDTITSSAASKALREGIVTTVANWICGITILFAWGSYARGLSKSKDS